MERTNRTRRRTQSRTQSRTQVPTVRGPIVTPLSPHISPLHDFYGYVNRVWEQRTPIPSYTHTIGVSEEIEEVVKKQLIGAIQTVHDPRHRIVVDSLLHRNAQHHSTEYMKSIIAKFSTIKTTEELGTSIGFLNRVQSHAPLSFVISSDSNDSKKCIVFIYEPELALPEKHLYTGHAERDVQARHALEKLLSTFALESTFAIEKDLLPHLSKVEDRKDITFYYNPISDVHRRCLKEPATF
jgi:predicted metalloendopeptidase